jgi:hypothetical protein
MIDDENHKKIDNFGLCIFTVDLEIIQKNFKFRVENE